MKHRILIPAAALLVAAVAGAQQRAPQYRVPPVGDLSGAPGLSLALRKLTTVGTLMQVTAHPDDENNGMLALYARRFGTRVALVTATRGDGGQNEIGSEIFDALGILRTEELLAAHLFDGAEQYFTRAVDFGYSFSAQETFDKWGRQEILGDFVRHIRTLRPDVIVALGTEGRGGGQHHQASGILAAEAFKAAANAARFPEQLREGLRPWQAKKLYRSAGGPSGRGGRGAPGRGAGSGRGAGGGGQIPAAPAGPAGGDEAGARFATLNTNVYEPLLGCTIGEIGAVAAGMHMCQGRTPVVPPPSATSARYRLIDTTLSGASDKDETSLFDGIDTSLVGLARHAGNRQPDNLMRGLAIIASHVASANEALGKAGPAATVPHLVDGLAAVRALRAGLESVVGLEEGRYEMDLRLALKETQFQDALVLAQGIRIEAIANDGLVVSGQPVAVNVAVANRGAGDVAVRALTLLGLDTDEAPPACGPGPSSLAAPFRCTAQARIPPDARLTGPYWERAEDAGRALFAADAPFGLPFRPTPFKMRIELEIAGAQVIREVPVQFRYDVPLTGEKRMELKVVPAFAVSVAPGIVVFPGKGGAASQTREVRVTVANGTKGQAAAAVQLRSPAGWRVTPETASVAFAREDEAVTTRFMVTAPANAPEGEVQISAQVTTPAAGGAGSRTFDAGYQVIEYPHTQRRHKLMPATASLKVIDATVAPGLSVGYIMGVGDQVPPALQQLGASVTLINADELAWGDLTKYHTIVTGVRAYERRDDLKANNRRVLEYVEKGGTVIVQYNKMEFNQAQYGPWPAQVSQNRVTDEDAPVRVLSGSHPVFTWPNRIDASAWTGWVQERGLYFLGERDPKYVDLVEMEDPFEFNSGPKRGALVEARYGKGRWIYVGLGLWRQLPAGTDGAYKLMANLVSLGGTRP